MKQTPPDEDVRTHVDSCPSCRSELEELSKVRGVLARWPDEAPPRSVTIPQRIYALRKRPALGWQVVKYGAIAAMALLAFLSLANADIELNQNGFAFRTHLFARGTGPGETYSKAEVHALLRTALEGTEARLTETNFLMIQRLLDTIEEQRYQEWKMMQSRYSIR